MSSSADSPKTPRSLELELFVVLTRAHRAVMDRAVADIRRYGLNPTEFAIMEFLFHKGPQPLQQLGARILITSGSITYVVNKLVEKGYVHRELCTMDRRITYASLTSKGHKRMAEIFPQHELAITEAMEGLDDHEKAQMIELLKKLGTAAKSSLDTDI